MLNTRQSGPGRHDKIPRVEIYWTAVTYRSVVLYGLLVAVSLMAILYLFHPEWYAGLTRRISSGLSAAAPTAASLALQNQARFVNLDGKVEVKKSAR